MTERTENGRITRLQIEVFYENTTGDFFIDVTDPTDRLNIPYTIGAFLTLDEALRYVYTTLDIPTGLVQVIGVTDGEITFTLDPLEPKSTSSETAKHDNVIDIRSKHGKDK
jgi:hypothetical protein|tara:strand:- start:199 stop:531 length:333 start_codon:yes stop_codon:yes gene_type:complete